MSQSGTQSCQLDAQSGGSHTQSGQSGTRANGTLTPASNNSLFEISSPPRSRGRPKTNKKVKLAARNRAVTMTREDSDLYNLTFKLYEFNIKPRAPTIREISKLPTTKRLISQDAYSHPTSSRDIVNKYRLFRESIRDWPRRMWRWKYVVWGCFRRRRWVS
ncbi:hypothetical protein JG688_00017146 [Phytophthora aleatoria]|uniref:Uncharacterized protein n=1 Tax=Phytophthora aleatoria TaxID=2496075 RepID=A0A8J5MCD5_9STRA|nr:hypothetical protein JG688_00017146 [Phytophthora aleatoria]